MRKYGMPIMIFSPGANLMHHPLYICETDIWKRTETVELLNTLDGDKNLTRIFKVTPEISTVIN